MTIKFCPGCGAQDTLEIATSVFVEHGVANGGRFENEGQAYLLHCTKCGEQCIDWSIDLAESAERDKVFPLVTSNTDKGYVGRIMQVRALCITSGNDSDQVELPLDAAEEHTELWLGMSTEVREACQIEKIGPQPDFTAMLAETKRRIEEAWANMARIDPETQKAVEAILANDEASSDEQLVKHFTEEMALPEPVARAQVARRADFLRNGLIRTN